MKTELTTHIDIFVMVSLSLKELNVKVTFVYLERSDRNRLYGRSSRRDGHGSVHAHANYYHQQHHHHHHSRRSPYQVSVSNFPIVVVVVNISLCCSFQADPYYDAGRRVHSRYDRRY